MADHYFEIGDQITVRPDLKPDQRYYMVDGVTNNTAVDLMLNLAGDTVTINDIKYNQYTIQECGYWWTDEMFEEYVYRDIQPVDYSKIEAASEEDLLRLIML